MSNTGTGLDEHLARFIVVERSVFGWHFAALSMAPVAAVVQLLKEHLWLVNAGMPRMICSSCTNHGVMLTGYVAILSTRAAFSHLYAQDYLPA